LLVKGSFSGYKYRKTIEDVLTRTRSKVDSIDQHVSIITRSKSHKCNNLSVYYSLLPLYDEISSQIHVKLYERDLKLGVLTAELTERFDGNKIM
jgi:hypothetical protein